MEKVKLEFFKEYQRIGGSICTFDEYKIHLAMFLNLTQDSYTGDSDIPRDVAFKSWEKYCGDNSLSKNEPRIFFKSVDNIHAYT